ncbi:MAG: PPC domain-containing protein [Anaerolineae bacterium]|nr:PPC domain-containing protein [Anaerolineae bacterium]
MNRRVVLFGILILVTALGVWSVFAGSASVSGTLDGSEPKMPVVFISSPNCTGQGAALVGYDAYAFSVDAAGVYTLDLADPSGNLSLYLMTADFNPAAAFPNCLAADNSGTISVSFALAANTTYYAVPFDDTFSQAGGSYTLTISGPGNVYFAGMSSGCTNPLPAGSVVYELPAGAPAFYAADLATQTSFNIPAGHWYISEFSGEFAKLWIACEADPVWVPANAVLR